MYPFYFENLSKTKVGLSLNFDYFTKKVCALISLELNLHRYLTFCLYRKKGNWSCVLPFFARWSTQSRKHWFCLELMIFHFWTLNHLKGKFHSHQNSQASHWQARWKLPKSQTGSQDAAINYRAILRLIKID